MDTHKEDEAKKRERNYMIRRKVEKITYLARMTRERVHRLIHTISWK